MPTYQDEGGSGGGSGSSIIELTVAEAATLATNETFVEGATYKITDPSWANWVKVKASSNKELKPEAEASFWNPGYTFDFALGASGEFTNIWEPNSDVGNYPVNTVRLWNNLRWENTTGVNTNTSPDSDSTNWTLLSKSAANGYIEVIDAIEYSLTNEVNIAVGVTKRKESEQYHNEIYLDIQYVINNGFTSNLEHFKWGANDINFSNVNNHAHTGLIDNKNAIALTAYNYVQGQGEFTVTGRARHQGNWVEGYKVNISGTGGVTECYFKGISGTLNHTSSGGVSYCYFSAGVTANISGSAQARGTWFNGVGSTYNFTDNAIVNRILFTVGDDSGATITAGLDGITGQSTEINNGYVTTRVSLDLTGKQMNHVQMSPEYSNMFTFIDIAGGAIDLDLPENRLCGRICLRAETGTEDDLATITNDSSAPVFFTLIPADGHDIRLVSGGNLTAQYITLPHTLFSANGDFAECTKSGNYETQDGIVGGLANVRILKPAIAGGIIDIDDDGLATDADLAVKEIARLEADAALLVNEGDMFRGVIKGKGDNSNQVNLAFAGLFNADVIYQAWKINFEILKTSAGNEFTADMIFRDSGLSVDIRANHNGSTTAADPIVISLTAQNTATSTANSVQTTSAYLEFIPKK